MSLKNLTAANHERAEKSWFAAQLLSGNIDPKLYYTYLYNQSYNYDILEQKVPFEMLGLDGMNRYDRIRADMEELENLYDMNMNKRDLLFKSTIDYTRHIMQLETVNPRGILAHLYVRHFGDMFGGAIVAKRVPGSGKMYQFDYKPTLIARLRSLLDDDMGNEANVCFDFAIRLFDDLEQWYEPSMENTV